MSRPSRFDSKNSTVVYVRIPSDLHRLFKTLVHLSGKSISVRIEELIRDDVESSPNFLTAIALCAKHPTESELSN